MGRQCSLCLLQRHLTLLCIPETAAIHEQYYRTCYTCPRNLSWRAHEKPLWCYQRMTSAARTGACVACFVIQDNCKNHLLCTGATWTWLCLASCLILPKLQRSHHFEMQHSALEVTNESHGAHSKLIKLSRRCAHLRMLLPGIGRSCPGTR